MCQPLPSDGNELYEKDGTDAKLMPHTGSLRQRSYWQTKLEKNKREPDGDSVESQKLKKPKSAFE
ncbi:hypothetical protein CsSME_00038745 [Camellia sinensis var. sinensis]